MLQNTIFSISVFVGIAANQLVGSTERSSSTERKTNSNENQTETTFKDGEDWPRWRGPRGNGTWRGPKLLQKWPKGELKRVWRRPVGGGYAGVIVAKGRVYVMDRQKKPDEVERVLCFHAISGKTLWSHDYPVKYGDLQYGNGPRAAPTVFDGRVYTLGSVGHLCCLDAATGGLHWSARLIDDYQGRMPTWGYAASPFVCGDLVVVQPGADQGGSVIAVDRKTGKLRWKALSDQAGYATPILIQYRGRQQLICWTPSHIRALAPRTGKALWGIPYKVTMGVSIATPVFHQGTIFVSGYWEGSKAIRLGKQVSDAKLLWQENRYLRGLMSQPLCRDGFAYLLDKQYGLTCFELSSGKKIWDDKNRMTPRGRNPQASLVWLSDTDRAFILNSNGELILARIDRTGYQELSRSKIIENTWAHPAYAGHHVYARNDSELICVSLPLAEDIKKKATSQKE